ncbi:N-methylhydantoinase [Polymorphobacter glacialis]|uniref:N-methylhydantoinase n=1 Tax=Sandarakinorhabdus glacialis TaxID=1614636 RepID=A0A917A0U3_9SPHN|nr:hydantoinase B/oxoprolinase family protein [Polymorphobacter glacialis]GGE20257.1 N-methylhydantoinase [Polymorphobacter glacialis]
MHNNQAATDWNGRTHSYRPKPDWSDRISPNLALHTDFDDNLDPVTFEVLRQKLWTINLAHGETITRISGSPLLAALDFNMSILTEDAEVVVNAPYVQFLNAGAPLGIRYILEKHSGKPGIDEGDIWCCNDPWIAACHQMDVMFAAPIFVDGMLFGWVANAGHQYDLGGIVPGGWPQNAEDVYSDPVVLTPFKMVERGELRPDMEALYLRQSRMPDLVALDLRAQIAGVVLARDQIVGLAKRYGAGTVKAAMRRMLDQAQESFRQTLLKVPDGTWTEIRYLDEALPGQRTTQRTHLTITKKGDRITINNAGTDAQTPGTNGIPFTSFSGSITGIISVSMLYAQLFAYGGCERQIDYDLTPGLLLCVDYPTAVSGGILQTIPMMNAVQSILSRMMACADELRPDLVAPCGDFMLPVLIGYDDRGKYFGQAILDSFGCGSGARSFGDGVNSSGPTFSPLSVVLNVELIEQWYPLLFLYRKEDADGGGAGEWRGGNGIRSAITPYRSQSMTVVTNSGGQCISAQNAGGLFGGLPSPAGHYLVRYGTDLLERAGNRIMPAGIEELQAERTEPLRAKSNGAALDAGDVMEIRVGGGGGYGDPLERDPARVARDVALGYASTHAATSIYGVALTSGGDVAVKPTEALRHKLRGERALWRASGLSDDARTTPATGEPRRLIHAYIASVDRDGERVLACDKCGHRYCGYGGDYKVAALMDEASVTTIPSAVDPAHFVDEPIVLRRFCCPGCHVQVCAEVTKADEIVKAEMTFS